jgi:hypothetical protein
VLFAGHAFAQTASTARIAGPLVASANPDYFEDARVDVVILSGSQTWNTLQDWGSDGSFETVDFNAFVNFLTAHGHNFTLLWRTELPKFCGFPGTASSPPDLTVSPHPWLRTGPGNATDGGLKIRSYQVRPKLFRPLTESDAGAKRRRHLRRRLFIHRRVAEYLPLSERRLPFYRRQQHQRR